MEWEQQWVGKHRVCCAVRIMLGKHKGEAQSALWSGNRKPLIDRSLREGRASLTGAKEACSEAGSLAVM